MPTPLSLLTPPTQDRLNAAAYECAHLRMTGAIAIPGDWDPDATVRYFEIRGWRTALTRTSFREFDYGQKSIVFLDDRVIINPRSERSAPASPAPVA
jgi:hypothetical protein